MDKPGTYRGRHYTEWVETVKDLKRAERYDEALLLLDGLMAAVEAEFVVDRLSPAPWYSEQAAIIRRKRKDHDAEVAVLERFLRIDPSSDNPPIATRLDKARLLRAKAT